MSSDASQHSLGTQKRRRQRPVVMLSRLVSLVIVLALLTTQSARASGDFTWIYTFEVLPNGQLECRASLEDMEYGFYEMTVLIRVWGPDGTLLGSDHSARTAVDYIGTRVGISSPSPGTYHCFAEVSATPTPGYGSEGSFGENADPYFTVN